MKEPRLGPGRPPKYGRAARAVTITLPEDVLGRLGALDADLGRAIVRLVERNAPPKARSAAAVELAAYGRHAVIVVRPLRALKRLADVELVPLGDGRALLSLSPETPIAQLELELRDALESGDISEVEREVLTEIVAVLTQTRRSPGLMLRPRTIIVLEPRPTRRDPKSPPNRRK